MFKNQKGVSLVQVLIAAGMMSGFVFVVMKQFDTASKSQRTLLKSMEEKQFMVRLSSFIIDIESCKNSFSGIRINIGEKLEITQIKDKNNRVVMSTPLLVGEGTSAKIEVEKFFLERRAVNDLRLISSIDRGKNQKGYFSSRVIDKEIPFIANFNTDNEIVSCYGDVKDGLEEGCIALNGIFDPVTGVCDIFDLAYGQHSSIQCLNLGGIVEIDPENGLKYCRVSADVYNRFNGWTPYKDFTATESVTSPAMVCTPGSPGTPPGTAFSKFDLSSNASYLAMKQAVSDYESSGDNKSYATAGTPPTPPVNSLPCTTGGHPFQNSPIETCTPGNCGEQIEANLLEIGIF